MKPISWVGILLIVLGALALAYQGINYTRQKRVLDVGPAHVTTETHERIPLPPILGGLALAGGVVLLFMGTRTKS
jgi:drug/metabolite transporter (DMT)-like permease